jgi:putative protease
MSEQLIGTVTHYFGKAGVAAIEITAGELNLGDTVHIVGHTSDFTATVGSMQIEHEPVESAKPGDHVGIRVTERARQHDRVYRVLPD